MEEAEEAGRAAEETAAAVREVERAAAAREAAVMEAAATAAAAREEACRLVSVLLRRATAAALRAISVVLLLIVEFVMVSRGFQYDPDCEDRVVSAEHDNAGELTINVCPDAPSEQNAAPRKLTKSEPPARSASESRRPSGGRRSGGAYNRTGN